MDSKLILQAQIRAGSRVHDVNGLMSAYRLWTSLAARGDVAAADVIERIERTLRRFVATGLMDRVQVAASLTSVSAQLI